MAIRDFLVILTPIVVVLLGLSGRVSLDKLKRGRGYALVLAFIVSAAVLPPPDASSMSMTAVLMYLLYEVGLVVVRFLPRM